MLLVAVAVALHDLLTDESGGEHTRERRKRRFYNRRRGRDVGKDLGDI